MSSTGATILFNALREGNSTIQDINLQENQFDDECMVSLGQYLKGNVNIKRLNLGSSKITDKGIEVLGSYLNGNTMFKSISFQGCRGLTDKSSSLLIKMVELSRIEYISILLTSITQQYALTAPLANNVIKYGLEELNLKEKYVFFLCV